MFKVYREYLPHQEIPDFVNCKLGRNTATSMLGPFYGSITELMDTSNVPISYIDAVKALSRGRGACYLSLWCISQKHSFAWQTSNDAQDTKRVRMRFADNEGPDQIKTDS